MGEFSCVCRCLSAEFLVSCVQPVGSVEFIGTVVVGHGASPSEMLQVL